MVQNEFQSMQPESMLSLNLGLRKSARFDFELLTTYPFVRLISLFMNLIKVDERLRLRVLSTYLPQIPSSLT